jgi:hypothetical protein
MTIYENCGDAVLGFIEKLNQRGITVSDRKKVPVYDRGRTIYEDRVFTMTKEVYHIKCRPKGRWYPKNSDEMSELGKELDERYKFLIRVFGNGDGSLSGLNEDTMIDLLELEAQGYTPYLVTVFPKTGEILWCHAYQAYDMIMRYGTLPQISFQGMSGMTLSSIPTGWMKKWEDVIVAPPTVVSE